MTVLKENYIILKKDSACLILISTLTTWICVHYYYHGTGTFDI